MKWGVLYNHITTFSRLTTVLSQLPNYLLTNHKDTKKEKKDDAFGGLSCGTLRERLRTVEIFTGDR